MQVAVVQKNNNILSALLAIFSDEEKRELITKNDKDGESLFDFVCYMQYPNLQMVVGLLQFFSNEAKKKMIMTKNQQNETLIHRVLRISQNEDAAEILWNILTLEDKKNLLQQDNSVYPLLYLIANSYFKSDSLFKKYCQVISAKEIVDLLVKKDFRWEGGGGGGGGIWFYIQHYCVKIVGSCLLPESTSSTST